MSESQDSEMEPMNGNSGNHNPKHYKHKSLLSKYDIPVDHLSFEYVGNCNDIKELEHIVKILKSGEEGYYPDLLRSAEDRLKRVNPNSRVLRVAEPILTKANFNEDEWNEVANDLKAWTSQMGIRDNELLEANNNTNVEAITYPSIRKGTAPKKKSHTTCANNSTATKRIASTDYRGWDKYDAETEIMKMDLEDEQQRQQQRKAEKRDKSKDEEVEDPRLQTIIREAESLTPAEREILANQERNKGNEYYKGNYFDDAIRCYTASIAIHPTAVAYSNRACCYLKQCKFTLALNDCNRALEMDPNNVKAYFRRGQALQFKNCFHEAARDIEEVLKREPNQKMAKQILTELRKQIRSLPRKVRLLVRDAELGKKKIIEVPENEWRTNPKLRKAVEVNEWGLPKRMCNCYGTPNFLRNTPKRHRLADHVFVNKQDGKSDSGCSMLTNGTMEDDNKLQIDSGVRFVSKRRTIEDDNKLQIDSGSRFVSKCSGYCGDVNKEISVATPLDEDDDDDEENGDVVVSDSNVIRNSADVSVDDDDDDDDEDPFENNGNFYFGSNRKSPVNDNNNPVTEVGSFQNTISFSFGNERNDKPKRLEILEVETDIPDVQSSTSSKTPDMSCPMDTSEKRPQPSRIDSSLELAEQAFVRSGAIPKTKPSVKTAFDTFSVNETQKTVKSSVNNISKKPSTCSKETKRSSDLELEMCSNKIPTISIANKYKQKVGKYLETDTSAVAVPNDCDDMPDLEEVPDSSPKKISPFQFGSVWTSKDGTSPMEHARLLRKVPPSSLHSLIGNKLDDQMLSSIVQCLSSQFDLSKEQALVQEYLSALTHLERFNVIKSFMPQQDKKVVCELVEKLNDARAKLHLRQAFGV